LIRTPLSSVDQRSNDIGCRTGKLILELLAEDASKETRKIVLQAKLAARASTHRVVKGRKQNASAA
jgi:DNA-binding LacI/PurR family transcriptional regulator